MGGEAQSETQGLGAGLGLLVHSGDGSGPHCPGLPDHG